MDTRGTDAQKESWTQQGKEQGEGLPKGTERKRGKSYAPGDLTNKLHRYLLFGKRLVLKFYAPTSISVLSKLLLAKHLEQSLACK